ncbi:ATP-dependent DNA ligase, partial [Streptomyces sp. NPDC058953]
AHPGPAHHPRALVVVLPGDHTPVVSTPLTPTLRAQAAALLPPGTGGEGRAMAPGLGEIAYREVTPTLSAEADLRTTRHTVLTITRLRTP